MQHVPIETADVARAPELPTGCALKQPADMAAFGDEVAGFFDYYLKDFRYDDEVVSLSRGGATTTAQLGWTREAEDALKMKASDDDGLGKVSYRLCIEDPFEINLNVGRNVSAFKLDVFKQNLAQGRLSGMGWLNKSL
jgi:DNA polymerase sigma